MGIIRKICFICLLFWALNLSAQTAYDTVYFSQKQFVKHVVKAGESLTSIAALHKVKTSAINKANELDKRLSFNQLLYIPIYLTNKDEESISVKKLILEERDSGYSITHIALLMPYYLLKNDTMFNRDTLDVSDRYYIQSEDALSFHIGVELAIDSLRRVGKKIVLHTFDTNDSVQVRKIVASNQLNEMDIIIGPMHSNLFRIMCQKYGQDVSKILISPLSRDNKAISQFPAVYQIALTYKAQAELLANYLIKNKLDERIIILNDKKEEGLAVYLKDKFKKHNKVVESFEITSTNIASITKYFGESQNVLLLSRDKTQIIKIFGSIPAIDAFSTVYTFEAISSNDNIDIINLMKVDVHIPNSRSIDASNAYDLNFLALFEKEYPTNVRKYSKEGFDIIMHFCGKANIYDFKQSQTGYFENTSVPIYHYLDYELVPAE